MSPVARADDSHDGRYTHVTSKQPTGTVSPLFPKILYGKPAPTPAGVVQDTVVVTSQADEDEKMKSGSWKESPADWTPKPAKGVQGGFARVGTLVLVCLCAVVLSMATLIGQTSLTQTTLGAALPAPTQGNQQTSVTLASGTNVAVGQGMFIDREYFRIIGSTPAATIWTVARGQGGTTSRSHNSGATVFIGALNNFSVNDVGGACVSTSSTALPHINVQTAQIANCPAVNTLAGSTVATWDQWWLGGNPVTTPSRYTGWTYTSAGALTVQSGVSFIGSSGALAMTLVNPTVAMNGLIMTIQASTAQAHTVTYTAGFNGGTTARDVATFGGAIGDQMIIYANNGVWWTLSLRNVTLG